MTEQVQAMECRKCGACCAKQGSPPLMPDELESLQEPIRAIVEAMTDADAYRYDDEMCCYFWNPETKLCRIHDQRPKICREFQPDGDGCKRWRDGATA